MKQFLVTFISSLILTIGLAFVSVDRVTSQQTNQNYNNLDQVESHMVETIASVDRTVPVAAEQKYLDIPDTADGKKFKAIVDYAQNKNLVQQPLGEIISVIGNQFIGAKYQGGLLDRTAKETLFISLQNFDCMLFVETVLALAKNISLQDYNYQNFTERVLHRRYRNGILNGYCSRLHYFSEWIADNQKRGNLTDITPTLGGIELPKTIDYMSIHWDKYPATIRTPENKSCVLQMEAKIAGMKIDYIPQKDIDKVSPQLRSGDIIGVATSIEGLDFTHTGFVNIVDRNNPNKVSFLHASPAGKVTIAPDLKTYIGRVKNAVGIVVARAI